MSTFRPNGTGHLALQALALSGLSKADVRRALGLPRAKQTKANALIERLRADGLVSRREDQGFWLTRLGEEVLAALDQADRLVDVECGQIMEPA